MNMKLNRIVCATAVVLAVFVAGCASVPKPSSALQEAQAAYEKAKGNTDVLKYASGNLNEANATLNSAAAATNLDDMNSLAYVANSQVQVAEAVAKRKSAEAQIAQLNTVKDSVQLEMRDAELAASQAQLAALKAKQTDRGTVVTLGSVLFATGKADLMPGAMDSINRLAIYLQANPNAGVVIEGHTDSTGSDATNLRLSQERADAVRTALLAKGIAPERVVATGLGSSKPVASNDTAAGRQANRRVEVIIN